MPLRLNELGRRGAGWGCSQKLWARGKRDRHNHASFRLSKKKSMNLEAKRVVMLRFLLAKSTLCCFAATGK